MKSLLSNYSKDKELEIRCKLSNPQIIEVFNNFIRSNKLKKQEKSLNIISGKKRKEIYYALDGKKLNEKFIEKNKLNYFKLTNSRNFNSFVSLSTEKSVNEFNIGNNATLRFKNRISFPIGDWRLDITHVKTVNSLVNIINIKNNFIKNDIFADNVINTDLLFGNSNLELEFEYIGNEFSEKDLGKIDNVIEIINNILFKNENNLIEYNKIIYDIAEKIDLNKSNKYTVKTLKQISNQAYTLDFATYKTIIYENMNDYFITDKADGERCFIQISDEVKIITSDILKIPLKSSVNAVNEKYIFDCEIVNKNIYIFDILYCSTENKVSHLSTSERLRILENKKSNINKIELSENYNIKFKKHYKMGSDYKNTINKLMNTKEYEIDGLIFTEDKPYSLMKTYKWKMPETQTIDFLVLKPLDKMLNIAPYKVKEEHDLLLLFTTISLNDFQRLNLSHIDNYNKITEHIISNSGRKTVFPFAFRPLINVESYIYYHPKNSKTSMADIIDNICEFGCFKGKWSLKRIRKDRKQQIDLGLGYGNYYTVAEDIYKFFLDPFPVEKLLEPSKFEAKGYFTYDKTNKYKSMIKFNSFVKANLIHFLEKSDLVIDLACGKGQDLFTMHGVGIKNMIMVDIDLNALMEIDKRKNSINDRRFYTYLYEPPKKYTIKTLNLDVIKNPQTTIDKILALSNQVRANGIILNFAIHYMIKTKQNMSDIVHIINSLLLEKGAFIFTCFDGKKIIDLLENTEEGKTLDIYEEDEVKYSIKKLYDKPDIGSKIAVKHHFSESYYEEYIILLDTLISEFIKSGFTVIKKGSFGSYLNNFESFNKNVYDKMTNNDKLYSSLYSFVMLSKNEITKKKKK